MVCSFPRQADSWVFDGLYRAGKIELDLVPQGNLAERMRAAGAGIGAFFCPTGVGTPLAEGKEVRVIDGRSHRLAGEARRDLCDLLGTEPLAPDSMVAQMATVRLPRPSPDLSQRLFTRHRVEIPVGGPEKALLRLSVAGYTTRDEIDRLLAALVRELDAEHG